MATEPWTIFLVLIVSVFGALGALFFKKGSAKLSLSFHKLIRNDMLFIGLLMYGISTPLYLIALKGGELSVLYPVVATTYIWSCLLSKYFLNEKMNKFKWVGVFLIVIGVIFIGTG